jgi:hypothetical protein
LFMLTGSPGRICGAEVRHPRVHSPAAVFATAAASGAGWLLRLQLRAHHGLRSLHFNHDSLVLVICCETSDLLFCAAAAAVGATAAVLLLLQRWDSFNCEQYASQRNNRSRLCPWASQITRTSCFET